MPETLFGLLESSQDLIEGAFGDVARYQFDRVLVVLDEEENDYRLYDYEKVLGDAQASIADRAAFANGEDNTWSRTLRLLYVCCTRAKRGLALVFFVADPVATAAHIVASGIFPEGSVVTQDVFPDD